MSRTFQVAWYVVLVSVVVIVVANVWYLSAMGDYTSAETRYIASYDSYDMRGMVSALWDMHNAQADIILAGVVFDMGFVLMAFGIALIAYGLYEREQPRQMPMPAYYPPQYPYPVPPPGYQYQPPYQQPPPEQRR